MIGSCALACSTTMRP
jgi:hypothetical protein